MRQIVHFACITFVLAAFSAPGGDPRVFRVDGAEIALRRETALRIHISPAASAA